MQKAFISVMASILIICFASCTNNQDSTKNDDYSSSNKGASFAESSENDQEKNKMDELNSIIDELNSAYVEVLHGNPDPFVNSIKKHSIYGNDVEKIWNLDFVSYCSSFENESINTSYKTNKIDTYYIGDYQLDDFITYYQKMKENNIPLSSKGLYVSFNPEKITERAIVDVCFTLSADNDSKDSFGCYDFLYLDNKWKLVTEDDEQKNKIHFLNENDLDYALNQLGIN